MKVIEGKWWNAAVMVFDLIVDEIVGCYGGYLSFIHSGYVAHSIKNQL